jgi:hypothetical protein
MTVRSGSLAASLSALAVSLAFGVFMASSASAYEQVGTFAGSATPVKEEKFTEEVQLGGVSGMAVNYTGAGGMPAGTIYAATRLKGQLRIARYNPDESFSEAWMVVSEEEEEKREGKGEDPYERCGPEGDPAYPNCAPNGNETVGGIDVDVDQTTGNVYAFAVVIKAGEPTVTEYSADGSKVIARFAEQAPNTDEVLDSPEMIHGSYPGGIAVNGAGEVFITDILNRGDFYHRLAVFKPQSPGDYEHYVYAGQSNDIAAGAYGVTLYPLQPVVDESGDIYVDSGETIQKYSPTPGAPPLCEYRFKKGGIELLTVNPQTGEVFFYTYKGQEVHRLSACKEGKFTELEAFEPVPERDYLYGLAVDPVREFTPGRPAGVLYGGAPSSIPGPAAKGPGEPGQSSLGYVFAPANEVPPEVLDEAVSGVTQTSARLEGKVNPKGSPSRYSFQYIADAAYQANEPADRFAGSGEVPPGGGPLEGAKALPVGDAVSGLLPDTLYHFRLRAVSHCASGEPGKECVSVGVDKTLRTYPLGGLDLADGRAYELVSPIDKNGGQVIPANPKVGSCIRSFECKPGFSSAPFPIQSAPGGNAIVYQGSPFSFDEGALIENQYVARRTDSGWQSVNPTPALLQSGAQSGYKLFTADLGKGVFLQGPIPLSPEAPAEFPNLYVQSSAEPASLTPLLTEPPPNREPGNINGLQLSFTGASSDFSRLFFSANDTLTPDAQGGPEAKTNLYESAGGELFLVNLAPGDATTIPDALFGGKGHYHEISADGSHVFWSSKSGQAYVREDGEVTREVTDHLGRFLSASTDGSKALLDDGCLYGIEAEACDDLTQGKGGFQGIAGQSEDLSRVYFVDTKVLSGEEENGQGGKAQEGKFNLYAWSEGTTTFIATLLTSDDGDWSSAPSLRSAAASPDGHWLAFLSKASLTGFDNTGLCIVEQNTSNFSPGPCAEVFLYQAETGELRCPSCNHAAAPPRGLSRLSQIRDPDLPPPRYLTNSGRLFFDSQDSLSASDTNGRVEDVYEFEPQGIGSCESPAGCVSLISAGRFGVDSNFLAADPSGKNVFFTSRDQLVEADKDDLIDLYDAREGGGFPPEAPSGECQGEACLPSVSPPNFPPSSSFGFRGPGNSKAAPKRCGKGSRLVRRKGKARCVKRHHRKHKSGRVHGERGGRK